MAIHLGRISLRLFSFLILITVAFTFISHVVPVMKSTSKHEVKGETGGVSQVASNERDGASDSGYQERPPAAQRMELCPVESVRTGLAAINNSAPTWSELEARHPELTLGGRWRPDFCQWRHRVAIVIPYRNREEQLRLFLQHMHPFLQSQNLDYGIYVTEQAGDDDFNRGLARNVGFLEALKLDDSDCTIFHDVDLLPLDHRNLYVCPDIPRHLCVAVDYVENFKPLYIDAYAMYGGVVAMPNRQFSDLNGYSNLYFGWGAEDDDLYQRVVAMGYTPIRYPDVIGRYQGLKHTSEQKSVKAGDAKDKFRLLRISKERRQTDGLNSSRYKVLKTERKPLYTRIHFDVVDQSRYEKEVKEAVQLYYNLYGSLSPYWGKLPFTPKPRWWENEAAVPAKFLQYRPKDKKKG